MPFDPSQPVHVEDTGGFDPDQPVHVEDSGGFDPDKPVDVESQSNLKPIKVLGGNFEIGTRPQDLTARAKRGVQSGFKALSTGVQQFGPQTEEEAVASYRNWDPISKMLTSEAKVRENFRKAKAERDTNMAGLQSSIENAQTDPSQDASLVSKGVEMAGYTVPVIAGGPTVAQLLGGVQMGGGAVEQARAEGLSKEEQDRRFAINTAVGIPMNALPGVANTPVGKIIARTIPGAGQFVKRGIQAVVGGAEGAAVNRYGDQAIQMGESGTVDPGRNDQNTVLGAAIGGFGGAMHTPGKKFSPRDVVDVPNVSESSTLDVNVGGKKLEPGKSYDARTGTEVDIKPSEDTPLLTPQSEAPAAEAPAVRNDAEHTSFNPDEPITTSTTEQHSSVQKGPLHDAQIAANAGVKPGEQIRSVPSTPESIAQAEALVENLQDGDHITTDDGQELVVSRSTGKKSGRTSITLETKEGSPIDGISRTGDDGSWEHDGNIRAIVERGTVTRRADTVIESPRPTYEPNNSQREITSSEDKPNTTTEAPVSGVEPSHPEPMRAGVDDEAAIEAQAAAQNKVHEAPKPAVPGGHIAVKIKRADGTVYDAVMNGYQEVPGGEPIPSIGRQKAGGWSHGYLKDGETLVTKVPSPEEFSGAVSPTSDAIAAPKDKFKANIEKAGYKVRETGGFSVLTDAAGKEVRETEVPEAVNDNFRAFREAQVIETNHPFEITARPTEKLTIRTRDGSQEVEVTPEQKTAYQTEKNWLKQTQDNIRNSNWDDGAKQKQLKRAAMQSAARVRDILKTPTAVEAKNAALDAQKLRVGRPVEFTNIDGSLAKGTVEKAPAFGKVTVKREDGTIIRMGANEAKVIVPTEAAQASPAPKIEPLSIPTSRIENGNRIPPLGRPPQNRAELVYELSRYSKNAEQVVQAFENGRADVIIAAAGNNRSLVGTIQSTYMQMKNLGLIPAHIDRQIKTALLTENRDLFRVFDGAQTMQGVGIVAIPNMPAPAEILDAVTKTSRIGWKAAKGALFNTTGGISKYIFDLVQDMHGRNSRMVEEAKRISYAISKSFGGELTPEVTEVAAAYLNPTRLNKMEPQARLRIQQAMAAMTEEQRSALNAARDRIDSMTQEVVALGVPKREFSEIMQSNVGRYVSRAYKIFSSDGENYIRNLTTKGTDAYKTRYLPATQQFGKDFVDKLLNLIKRRSDLNRVEVDNLVRDQIKGLGSTVALDRTVREQTIRNLFGEVVDPVQSVAYTLVKQQELASTFKFRQQIADNLTELGLGRKIDPEKIIQDYITNEAAVIKEGADARVAEATKARAAKGLPMTPDVEKAIRDQYAQERPTFSAQTEARTKALMTEAIARGDKADLAKATRNAEREIYSQYEENAMEWYNRSGEVKSGETMVRQDPIYQTNMAMSGRVNDPFAALVVKNEALPLLAEYRKLQPHAMNLLQEFATITNTGATVLSPMTTARNIITSNQTILASGNLLRSVATEAGRDAWGKATVIAKHLMGGGPLPKELEGIYNEMVEVGVLNKGALSGDTANLISAVKGFGSRLGQVGRILKAEERLSLEPLLAKGRRLRPEEAIAKMAWGNEAGWEKLARKTQDIYQLGDSAPKIVNYLIEKAKAIEAYGDTPMALAEAQRKFGMTNFDYSRVIPFVRAIRKYPLIGGFTSFITETYRTAINSVGLAVEDTYKGYQTGNKALIKQGLARMAGVSAALGGAAIAAELSRDSLGLTYEDDRQLKQFLPEWDRNSHIVWYRQGDGKVGYMNLGNSALFSAFTRPAFALIERMAHGPVDGNPTATLGDEIKTQFWNVVNPFISWQISAQAMKEAISGVTQAGVPIWAADDGEGDKIIKSAWHIMTGAFTPGFVKSGKPVVQGLMGETDRHGEPISPAKPLMALAGIGEIDGAQAVKYYARDQNRIIRGIEGEFKRMTEDMTSGITDDTVYAKLQDVEDRRREYFNNLHLGVVSALQMDTPRASVIAQLKQQGFNTQEVAAILTGHYEPYVPSVETMQRARKAGRPLNFKTVRQIVQGARD